MQVPCLALDWGQAVSLGVSEGHSSDQENFLLKYIFSVQNRSIFPKNVVKVFFPWNFSQLEMWKSYFKLDILKYLRKARQQGPLSSKLFSTWNFFILGSSP